MVKNLMIILGFGIAIKVSSRLLCEYLEVPVRLMYCRGSIVMLGTSYLGSLHD